MSDQDLIVNLIRDQFEQMNQNLVQLNETLKDHTTKDEAAWARINDVENEIKVVKRVGLVLVSIGTAVTGWLGISR